MKTRESFGKLQILDLSDGETFLSGDNSKIIFKRVFS